MTTIDKQTEEANPGADTFEYSAEPLFLEDAVTVSFVRIVVGSAA
jgi:hypothetical protein